MLTVIGDAWAAFKMPGLTCQIRLEDLHALKYMVTRILGPALFDIDAIKKARTGGFVTKQLLDMMYDVEHYLHVVGPLSPALQNRFQSPNITTLMNENEFTYTFSITGGRKPTVEQLQNSTLFRDVVLGIKADPDRNFGCTTSKRQWKDPTDATILDEWNNGLGDYKRWFHTGPDSVEKRTKRMQAGNYAPKVRDYHKMGIT